MIIRDTAVLRIILTPVGALDGAGDSVGEAVGLAEHVAFDTGENEIQSEL